MKILLVSSGSGSRGGGEIFLDYLGSELSTRGHEVVMWIPDHAYMDELAARCAHFAQIIRAHYTNTYGHAARSLATCFNDGVSRRIARDWRNLRPDVIHVNKQNLEDGLDLLRAARMSALPSICTIHLTQTARYLRAKIGWLRDWIAYWQLKRYRGTLVAVQEERRRVLADFLGNEQRTRTVFNGVPRIDADLARQLRAAKRRELGLSDSDFLVLGLGRLVKQKQPFLFLRIAKELYAKGAITRALWVGDGGLRHEWSESVARDHLDHTISCAGWQGDVTPYLLAGDLLLHVAAFEGLPFVVIEAMAAGLPCAVTRALSSEVPLFTDRNVLYADDVDGLAIRLRDRNTLAAVSRNALQLIDDKLSVSKMAASYEQLYREACAGITSVAAEQSHPVRSAPSGVIKD
jgi:glycosyltransferase involved in cell wall biosynthesis